MITKQYDIIREEEHILNGHLINLLSDLIEKNKGEDFIINITNNILWNLCTDSTRKEVTFFKTFWDTYKSIAVVLFDSFDKMAGYLIFTATVDTNSFKEIILEEFRIGVETIYVNPKKDKVVKHTIM